MTLSTCDSNRFLIRNHILPFFGAMRVVDITRAHARRWFGGLSERLSTANRTLPVPSVGPMSVARSRVVMGCGTRRAPTMSSPCSVKEAADIGARWRQALKLTSRRTAPPDYIHCYPDSPVYPMSKKLSRVFEPRRVCRRPICAGHVALAKMGLFRFRIPCRVFDAWSPSRVGVLGNSGRPSLAAWLERERYEELQRKEPETGVFLARRSSRGRSVPMLPGNQSEDALHDDVELRFFLVIGRSHELDAAIGNQLVNFG